MSLSADRPGRFVLSMVLVALALTYNARTARAGGGVRGCRETSDIVGDERCSRFGDSWSSDRIGNGVPRIALSLDLIDDTLDPSRYAFKTYSCRTCTTYSFSGRALGTPTLHTYGASFRVEGYLFGPVYVGARWLDIQAGNGSIGGGNADGIAFPRSNGVVTLALVMPVEPLVGVRIPLGWLSLRIEASAGLQIVELDRLPTSAGTMRAAAAAGFVDGRGVLDVWATAHYSVSAYGGVNLLDVREHELGLLFGYHFRAFDGAFALW